MQIDDAELDEYWSSSPARESIKRLGILQSETLDDRATLDRRFRGALQIQLCRIRTKVCKSGSTPTLPIGSATV